MPNNANAPRIICPYYQRETPTSITCEGLSPDTSNVTRFGSRGQKRRYQIQCCERYCYAKACAYAALLEKEYAEKEDKRR